MQDIQGTTIQRILYRIGLLQSVLMVVSYNALAIENPERDVQRIICQGLDQQVSVKGGGWADCVSETHAIEVDWTGKWAEAIGQSLYYAEQLEKKPMIYLVCKEDQSLCLKHSLRLESTIAYWNLPVEFELFDIRELGVE